MCLERALDKLRLGESSVSRLARSTGGCCGMRQKWPPSCVSLRRGENTGEEKISPNLKGRTEGFERYDIYMIIYVIIYKR